MQRADSFAISLPTFKTTQSYQVDDFTCISRFASTIVAINAIDTVPVNAWVTCTVIKVVFTVHSWKKKNVTRIRSPNLSRWTTELALGNSQLRIPPARK